jgi:hypothetical protein
MYGNSLEDDLGRGPGRVERLAAHPRSENGEPLSKSEIKKRQKAEEKERLKAEKASC